MNGPGRSRVPVALLAALALVAVACGDKGKPDDDKIAKAEGEEKAAEVEAKADGGGVEAWKMDVGKAARADVGAGAAEAGAVEAGAAEAGAAEAGAAEGAEAGAAEAGEPAPPDPATLLTEVKNKKTKDDRAMAALAEAETAGAKPKDLAKAAKARGDALHDAPERAKPFYEWASAKDPKSPDAAFALAKQAVNVGEIEEAKKHLQVVHERKGKKLLQQLAFDPMWEIVKDDPDVKGWYDADG